MCMCIDLDSLLDSDARTFNVHEFLKFLKQREESNIPQYHAQRYA